MRSWLASLVNVTGRREGTRREFGARQKKHTPKCWLGRTSSSTFGTRMILIFMTRPPCLHISLRCHESVCRLQTCTDGASVVPLHKIALLLLISRSASSFDPKRCAATRTKQATAYLRSRPNSSIQSNRKPVKSCSSSVRKQRARKGEVAMLQNLATPTVASS